MVKIILFNGVVIMKISQLSACIATVLSAVLLTACVGTSATTPSAKPVMAKSADLREALAVMTWQLSSVGMVGKTPSANLKSGDAANRYSVTLVDNRIGVRGGCNIMGGGITLGAPYKIKIGPMMGTRRACPGTLMKADAEVSDYLSSVTSYTVDGTELALITDDARVMNFKGTPAMPKK
jgi:heat shock protein HslJ